MENEIGFHSETVAAETFFHNGHPSNDKGEPGKASGPSSHTPAEADLPEILFITSYPPRECGIATYSHDLIAALNNKFDHSFKISICPLESENEKT